MATDRNTDSDYTVVKLGERYAIYDAAANNYRGRFMCSFFDTRKEAESFLKRLEAEHIGDR